MNTQPPIPHSDLPARTQGQETKTLHDVFTPLCQEVAHLADPNLLQANESELVATVESYPSYDLPADYSLTAVPWDVFKDISDDQLQAAFEAPGTRSRADYMLAVAASEAWSSRHPEIGPKDYRHVLLHNNIRELCFATKDEGNPLDVNTWRQYEQQVESLPEDEQRRITDLQAHRRERIWVWESSHRINPEVLGQAATIKYLTNETIPYNIITSELVLPVGEYDEEHTDDILRTTALMQGLAQKYVPALAAEATAGNESTLVLTARAHGGEQPDAETTMATLQEGILSVGQTLDILSLHKVEGYEDSQELMRAIVDAGLVSRFARFSAMGIIGPMALSGKYVQPMLERTENGVTLSATFEAYLKTEKEKFVGKMVLALERRHAGSDTAAVYAELARMCAAADMGGGIDTLAHRLVDLLTIRKQNRQNSLKPAVA